MNTLDELTDAISAAEGLIIADHRGLTVTQLAQLRNALRQHTVLTVTKNTYARIAARRTGKNLELMLHGPTVIAFTGNPCAAAKTLITTIGLDRIKGGYLDGELLSPRTVSILADTPPREVLLARLAGAMTASLAGTAALFNALKETRNDQG